MFFITLLLFVFLRFILVVHVGVPLSRCLPCCFANTALRFITVHYLGFDHRASDLGSIELAQEDAVSDFAIADEAQTKRKRSSG
jgi:hypothetical protein